LEKWGPGCYFFGHGDEFEKLESQLQTQYKNSGEGSESPVLALFCEVTSNPLLKTPDLRRLRVLADKYGFAIVVDETIGNYVNVDVLPYADIVCSSLTKVFSGETNVMGGGYVLLECVDLYPEQHYSMILNPRGRFYDKLKPSLLEFYEDTYWDEDAIFLERNSRDFKSRVAAISRNAEAICDLLYSHSLEATQDSKSCPLKTHVIKKVYYPKFMTTDLYHALRTPKGGYGGLCSITFTSPIAAQAFFDNLGCEKGPSLGTNFTLACPFVILAHYTELDWVKQFGIDPYLVRISVGLEDRAILVGWIENAIRAAEVAMESGLISGNGSA
jgi:cystathionine gamma-synthase